MANFLLTRNYLSDNGESRAVERLRLCANTHIKTQEPTSERYQASTKPLSAFEHRLQGPERERIKGLKILERERPIWFAFWAINIGLMLEIV
jgi:hypothetical protein